MSNINGNFLPKIIWMLWLQGWDLAPYVAKSCRNSWEGSNPGWMLHFLDLSSLNDFLPTTVVNKILSTSKKPEALSDLVILPFLRGGKSRIYAAMASRCFGVIPPKAILGLS